MRLTLVASSALTLVGLAQAIDHFPYPCHQTYQVAKGDTCKSIAATAGTDVSTLQLWNQDFHDNFNCSSVTPGQLLCVDYSTSITKRAAGEAPAHGAPHVDVAAKKGKKHSAKKEKKHHGKKPHHKRAVVAAGAKKAPHHPKKPHHGKKHGKPAEKKADAHKKGPHHPAKKPHAKRAPGPAPRPAEPHPAGQHPKKPLHTKKAHPHHKSKKAAHAKKQTKKVHPHKKGPKAHATHKA